MPYTIWHVVSHGKSYKADKKNRCRKSYTHSFQSLEKLVV